jgi:hypothetical protein
LATILVGVSRQGEKPLFPAREQNENRDLVLAEEHESASAGAKEAKKLRRKKKINPPKRQDRGTGQAAKEVKKR